MSRPSPTRRTRSSSYAAPAPMAFSKIVGFDVTPTMPCSSTRAWRPPPRTRWRVRLSYQGLWPSSRRRAIGLVVMAASGSAAGSVVEVEVDVELIVEQRERGLHDRFDGEAQVGQRDAAGGRRAEAVEPEAVVGEAVPADGG